jgi:hypothetical protein
MSRILNGEALALGFDLRVRTQLVKESAPAHEVRDVLTEDARACGLNFFLAGWLIIRRLLAVPVPASVPRAVHWSTSRSLLLSSTRFDPLFQLDKIKIPSPRAPSHLRVTLTFTVQRTRYMQLQKYHSRIALMSRIKQPLTQIHFHPSQLFLVNVGDMTYGHSNVVISAVVQRLFHSSSSLKRCKSLQCVYLLCGTNALPYSGIQKIISSKRLPQEITSILERRLQLAMLSSG